MTKALILVDVQNDFAPSGALPVPQGDEIIPIINQLLPCFDHVIATQDWHPQGHSSFASEHNKTPGECIELGGVTQVMWPDHCVQGTDGAAFIPGLNTGAIDYIVQKGTNPNVDSYSGFFDNQRIQATGLEDYLRQNGLTDVYIVGLATDYCVKFTALDAVELGFNTWVIQDACRGVDMTPGDVENALSEMQSAGCTFIQSSMFIQSSKVLN
ncbi:bifunctional nicotinamidase/pyrazinamidase [Vibrio rhizosphaerae]|uniref:bifunctional nicotinamidase/pyrazinamidase n=1 Tax=Vibrio rhizosphaerae TaxID=398736 RepID=UPI00056F2213|nr:bifunctional nicotinamidase/pyrazinamidase [Vibrio rhizosphaerae]